MTDILTQGTIARDKIIRKKKEKLRQITQQASKNTERVIIPIPLLLLLSFTWVYRKVKLEKLTIYTHKLNKISLKY